MAEMEWHVDMVGERPATGFPIVHRISEEVQAGRYSFPGVTRLGGDHGLFEFILGGAARFHDATGIHPVPAGSGFLCRVADPAITYERDPAAAEPLHLVYMVMSGAAFDMIETWVGKHGPVCQLPISGGFIDQLRGWRRYHGQRRPLGTGRGLRLVADLFTALEGSLSVDPDQALCRQAIDLVVAEPQMPIAIADLAQRLGIRREYLTRAFQRQFDQPPYRYLLRVRLDEAARRLINSDRPIATIATELSFDSAAHFSRVFKRMTGMAPSECRRRRVLPV